MATITKRNNGWRVQVRLKGISKSATLRTKAAAQQWALETESNIAQGFFDVADITFAQLIDKYIKEVTINKRGARNETLRLTRLCAMPIGNIRLIDLTERDFIQWRDDRLKKVSAASVLREWNTLSHVMSVAVEEWKYLKINHLKGVKKQKPQKNETDVTHLKKLND